MNKLSILLLIYFLSLGSANAAKVEPIDISFSRNGTSSYVFDTNNDEIKLTTQSKFPPTSQFASEDETVPPTFWIVGLGLCLVFLGYKMKMKHTNK